MTTTLLALPEIYYPPDLFRPAGELAHSRLRRRFLEDVWTEDAARALELRYGEPRAKVIDVVDTSWNVPRDTWEQISALYYSDPQISNVGDIEPFKELLEESDWRATMEQFQPYIVGQREGLVVLRVDPEDFTFSTETVPIDLVAGMVPDPAQPHQPIAVCIWRDLGDRWVLETFDARGEGTWKLTEQPEGQIKTFEELVGGDVLQTSSYPFVHNGKPFVPAVLYHAKKTNRLTNPYFGSSLVAAGLETAVRVSATNYAFQETAHRSRNAIDLEPSGSVTVDPNNPGIASIPTLPGHVQIWNSRGDKPGSLQDWDSPVNPGDLLRTTMDLAAIAVSAYGISPTDLRRTSDNPQSGVTISLTNARIRQENRRYSQSFGKWDRLYFAVVAKCGSIWRGYKGPVDRWGLVHAGLPKSPEETKSENDTAKEEGTLGIVSKVDNYMRRFGVSREVATKALDQILKDDQKYGKIGEVGTPAAPVEGATSEGTEPVAPAAATKKIADEALNGAQLTALFTLGAQVAKREVSREFAIQAIAAGLQKTTEEATKIIADLGSTFFYEDPAVNTNNQQEPNNNDTGRTSSEGSGGQGSEGSEGSEGSGG